MTVAILVIQAVGLLVLLNISAQLRELVQATKTPRWIKK